MQILSGTIQLLALKNGGVVLTQTQAEGLPTFGEVREQLPFRRRCRRPCRCRLPNAIGIGPIKVQLKPVGLKSHQPALPTLVQHLPLLLAQLMNASRQSRPGSIVMLVSQMSRQHWADALIGTAHRLFQA